MRGRVLLCRAAGCLFALPFDHVVEVMRPLPVEPLDAGAAPAFVRGLAIIRGEPVPVIDLALLIGRNPGRSERYVTVRANGRTLALAADAVPGIRILPPDALKDVPSLLAGADAAGIAALGVLDSALLVVLREAQLIPEPLWAQFEAVEATA